jgi:beta-galactosidase
VLRTLPSLIVLLIAVATCCPALAQEPPTQRSSFNADWRFTKDDPQDAGDRLTYAKLKPWLLAGSVGFLKDSSKLTKPDAQAQPPSDVSYAQPTFDDSQWRQLTLPHDWGIEGEFKQEYPNDTGKLAWWGVGWYRKHLDLPDSDKGKQIYLDIDGAMAYASVWVNGHFVGGWPYGYSSFRVDLTPQLKAGDNVIAIRLDNPQNSSRWYPGGGIYRNVWLVKSEPVHLAHWGVYVTTPKISQTAAETHVKVIAENKSDKAATYNVRVQLFECDASGNPAGKELATLSGGPISIAPGAHETTESGINIPNPKLWTLSKPQLYAAVVTIERDGKAVDRCQTNFGIRTIEFSVQKGFLLNGQVVKLNGVCDHHDLGPLGSAINTRALERQIQILQEMGCNAIRTSHNPPAPELLDLCDRMGMLVMDEMFDCWQRGKTPNDYNKLFPDWHEQDARMLLRRDRNHPCVVIWSIGNEIPDQGSPVGTRIAGELAGICHEEDPTRPVSCACNDFRAAMSDYPKQFDIFGLNYKPTSYGQFRQRHPDMPLFGSETASCVSSRGEYVFPVSDNKAGGKSSDYQMSDYDLYAPPWAQPPDWEFKGQDQNPFVAGEFVWTGFDYLGEPTPFSRRNEPSRSSYFGIVDLCGFKKDRFYIYQARWRPDLPMAHLLPHWNWPDRAGQVTPVHLFTSGDEAELFLNDKSLGRKKKGPLEYRIRWDDVVYQPGTLKAVAYKDGKEWVTETVKTTGAPAKIILSPDRMQISADGSDLCFVTVKVVDKDGLTVPTAKSALTFEVTGPAVKVGDQNAPAANNTATFPLSGPGEIAGIDNGDATDHTAFHSLQHKAFNGLCLVIVRSKPGGVGEITLKASGEGLEAATATIKTQ